MNGKEFIRATDAICKEKGIDKDTIFEAMKTALEKAYAKHTGFSNIRIDIDTKNGQIRGYAYQTAVEKYGDSEENEEALAKFCKKVGVDENMAPDKVVAKIAAYFQKKYPLCPVKFL